METHLKSSMGAWQLRVKCCAPLAHLGELGEMSGSPPRAATRPRPLSRCRRPVAPSLPVNRCGGHPPRRRRGRPHRRRGALGAPVGEVILGLVCVERHDVEQNVRNVTFEGWPSWADLQFAAAQRPFSAARLVNNDPRTRSGRPHRRAGRRNPDFDCGTPHILCRPAGGDLEATKAITGALAGPARF